MNITQLLPRCRFPQYSTEPRNYGSVIHTTLPDQDCWCNLKPRRTLTLRTLCGWTVDLLNLLSNTTLCKGQGSYHIHKMDLPCLAFVGASVWWWDAGVLRPLCGVLADQQLSVVTPELLRQTLQGKGSSDLGGEKTCQQLLCYAARDKQHHGLLGLPLLPLQDGSWSTFSQSDSDSAVYLCSAVEAEALLGLEGLMASTCVTQSAREALQDVAHSGQCCPLYCCGCGPSTAGCCGLTGSLIVSLCT